MDPPAPFEALTQLLIHLTQTAENEKLRQQERDIQYREEQQLTAERFERMMEAMTTSQTKVREQAEQTAEKKMQQMQIAEHRAKQTEQDMKAWQEQQKELMEKNRQDEKLAFDQREKKLKEEREKKRRINALPKPQPMSLKEDVLDYLDTFVSNMEDREIPKLAWPSHLLPLLNASCRAAVASLPLEQKQDFDNLKDVLLATVYEGHRYPGQQLFDGQINSGESVRAACTRLLRLANRYAPEDDPEVVRNKMVMEIILRALPADAADYVRE